MAPSKNTAWPLVTGNFLICQGRYLDQGSDEWLQAINGNALDH